MLMAEKLVNCCRGAVPELHPTSVHSDQGQRMGRIDGLRDGRRRAAVELRRVPALLRHRDHDDR